MIELRTGLPGGGKTLAMVEALARLQARWEKFPEEARAVFVHGIADLLLPHSLMPTKQVQGRLNAPMMWVPDWEEMPDGSLVIIDEAQGFFPPRSSQSTPPEHVSWLNTHRHKGFDIWVTTQHPKLIDGSVRALIGKHQHYRRMFGGRRAVVYEFDGCNDNLSQLGSGVMSYWPYPKKVFQWYKSAEVHTKQTFKLPKWLLIPVAGVVMGIYFIPSAVATLSSGMSGNGVSRDAVNGKIAPAKKEPAAPGAPSALPPPSRPLVTSFAQEKILTPFTQPVVLAAACIASEKYCKCYSAEGVNVPLPFDTCVRAATENVNFASMKP